MMDFAKRNAEACEILAKRLVEVEAENERLREENQRLKSEIREMLHRRDL